MLCKFGQKLARENFPKSKVYLNQLFLKVYFHYRIQNNFFLNVCTNAFFKSNTKKSLENRP